ncbi:hypothetical protein RA27_10325 [Ruegeria sp. ANG-R]|uniref:oligosaccharide flippase family protein n=1 Tax=Ruegeria sp. ANG-R TaxID=1577903 RepID=UPI00057DB155|nr:oligosaccharide flippase family protein [Ruegeria sp. ANG-R]KIC41618.1 hypothetical protein RA27_10325 [Ruegeria sp. ANG-R]
MLTFVRTKLKGDGIGARVIRGSALTFFGFGASQFFRLGSNLILTRLLFPEAFGLLAIVNLYLTGLQMLSDIGLTSIIVRSKRGEDPVFLDTCWTLQVIRGLILAGITIAIAQPLSEFYEEPILNELMYGVAFSVFVMGLRSTRLWTAQRNILLGRITFLELGCQLLSICVMIGLALVWESVWALMLGVIVAHASKAILSHFVLPGHANRFRLERAALIEQFHFGKYLFLSSGLGFLLDSGDRVLLSKYLSLSSMGFYNIAFFFASVPTLLMGRFVQQVIFPLYSARPPGASSENRTAISKTRFALTGSMLSALFALGLIGLWLISFLYTDEYQAAGPILVALTVSQMPSLIIQGYPILLVAEGKTGIFTAFQVFRATLQLTLTALGLVHYGLVGAIAARPLAAVLTYPVIVFLIRRYRGQDILHDVVFAVLTVLFSAIVIWLNGDVMSLVAAIK